jgi:4-amino-4-deoxychorismate lyase
MEQTQLEHNQPIVLVDPQTDSFISYQMDEGLSFGLGFFETILVREKPYYLKEHLHRLNQSLTQFGFDRSLQVETVQNFINYHAIKDTVLKLIVTQKNQLALLRPIPYDKGSYASGKKVRFSKVIKSRNSQLIAHKTLNYGENMLALRSAQQAGYDDCLFLNEIGNVTESAIANLFMIQNNRLLTPPLEDGLLPGVIRSEILSHFPVLETPLRIDQVTSCQGAFLTNSLMGAMPITQIETRTLPPHPLCEEVMQFFKEMTHASDGK